VIERPLDTRNDQIQKLWNPRVIFRVGHAQFEESVL
jgi:hypothetical protein